MGPVLLQQPRQTSSEMGWELKLLAFTIKEEVYQGVNGQNQTTFKLFCQKKMQIHANVFAAKANLLQVSERH